MQRINLQGKKMTEKAEKTANTVKTISAQTRAVKKTKTRAGNERSVVKSNRLNSAIHNLKLEELRLIQFAIVESRESGAGFSAERPLRIHAADYAAAFGISTKRGYNVLDEASTALANRTFTFIDRRDGNLVRSNWLQQVKYLTFEGAIELVFTEAVANEIYNLDGNKGAFFTQYALKQTAILRSVYAVRLYELLAQWVSSGQYTIDLVTFRRQLEVPDGTYPVFFEFRRRVFTPAIELVRQNTNIAADYEFVRHGRSVTGVRFYNIISRDVLPVDLPEKTAAHPGQTYTTLTEKQAWSFYRKMAKDPEFLSYIPSSCVTTKQGEQYATQKLQTDPEFVKAVGAILRKYGFVGQV